MTNLNMYISEWIEKIENNIINFKNLENVSDEQKVEFITHQYHLVMLIYRALNGQVIFVGARPI